jgi:hypothetical protein
VEKVSRGPKKKQILLLFGKISALCLDPGRVQWSNDKPFMTYTTKMGREILCKKQLVPHIPTLRWSNYLPPGSTFNWKANWDPEHTSKEAGLICQVWHRTVAVNE